MLNTTYSPLVRVLKLVSFTSRYEELWALNIGRLDFKDRKRWGGVRGE